MILIKKLGRYFHAQQTRTLGMFKCPICKKEHKNVIRTLKTRILELENLLCVLFWFLGDN